MADNLALKASALFLSLTLATCTTHASPVALSDDLEFFSLVLPSKAKRAFCSSSFFLAAAFSAASFSALASASAYFFASNFAFSWASFLAKSTACCAFSSAKRSSASFF